MTRESILRILAGFFVLLSLALDGSVFNGVNWLWFTAFVGLNLFQSGFTGFCIPEKIMVAMDIGKPCNWKEASVTEQS